MRTCTGICISGSVGGGCGSGIVGGGRGGVASHARGGAGGVGRARCIAGKTGASGARGVGRVRSESLRSAVKMVVADFAAVEMAAVLLELVHTEGGESGNAVVLGVFMVSLMDRHGSVDDMRLNGFWKRQ